MDATKTKRSTRSGDAHQPKYKSLSDMLRGKEGMFRGNLSGKARGPRVSRRDHTLLHRPTPDPCGCAEVDVRGDVRARDGDGVEPLGVAGACDPEKSVVLGAQRGSAWI